MYNALKQTGTFVKGMVLAIALFLCTVPFSTALPTKDVTLDVSVKRVLNSGSAPTNVNKNGPVVTAPASVEELKPVNKKYTVKQDDEIIVEIHLLNPSQQKIISTETWLTYDPKKLTGLKIDNADSKFDLITPGENEFVPDQNVVRIGRGNTTGGIDEPKVKVAAIHFKVIATKGSDTTELKFYDFQPNELGHTNVNIISGGLPFNVLAPAAPEPIRLVLNGTVTPPTGTTNPPTGTTKPPSTGTNNPPVYTGSGSFYPSGGKALPIPKNIHASTTPSSITVSWDPVMDGRVKNYYLYYTTHQNQYLHRKRVSGNSITLSNLTVGDRYYFVVTSADAGEYESGYSPELSIVVGQNTSVSISSELSSAAIESLNKLSHTAGSGPAEDMLLLMLLLSCTVYPGYRLIRALI